jgi:UDP-glucose 4-epimerase
MRNILVTGGAGFIGSHISVELIAAGYRPVIIDNFTNSDGSALKRLEKLAGKSIAFYEADYQDAPKLREIFKKESIDGIIHLAASKYVGESVANPLPYYRNNVAGFVTLLESALEQDIKRIVLSSSAAVYGSLPAPEVTEDLDCKPLTPYGWSKRMDEIILRDTCSANPQLRGVALRYFNVIGSHESAIIGELPKQQPKNLAQAILRTAAGINDTLTLNGNDYPTPDGTCLRDYVHVVDLAKAHVAALKHIDKTAKPNFDVYNIGTGKPTSALELVKAFEKVSGVKPPYKFGPRRPGDAAAYYAVPDKAKRELGWSAEHTVDDAMRDAWAWRQSLQKSGV